MIIRGNITAYTLPKGIEGATLDGSVAKNLIGNAGNNELTGNANNNILDGGDGNDYLYSASGDDTVLGGGGDDQIVGGDGKGDDTYDGGDGEDAVIYKSSERNPVEVNLRSGFAKGIEIGSDKLTGIEHIIAGQSDDIIVGNSKNNKIDGLAGRDAVNFQGRRSEYVVSRNSAGEVVIQDKSSDRDGTDTLINIESFNFAGNIYNGDEVLGGANDQDILTGIKILDSSTGATKVAGNDGITDQFALQTNAAPSTPFNISKFNPADDFLQIPKELAGTTAPRTFFGVAKVILPDRPLTKTEQKLFSKQQKAVSKSVKRIGTTGDRFAYNQLTGQLFLDTNGKKKGFGVGGGLLAVLEDTPAIGIDNFQFL